MNESLEHCLGWSPPFRVVWLDLDYVVQEPFLALRRRYGPLGPQL